VRIAAAAHTDLDAVGFEQIGVVPRGVLHAAIRVMDQPAAGLRVLSAICKASMVSVASSVRSSAQPTTLRENALH
jgi:hypothetical protein